MQEYVPLVFTVVINLAFMVGGHLISATIQRTKMNEQLDIHKDIISDKHKKLDMIIDTQEKIMLEQERVRVALFGYNNDNGLRSEIRRLIDAVDTLEHDVRALRGKE